MPDPTPLSPTALKGDEQALTITWSDGLTQRITWQRLRDHCPCANCRTKRQEPPAMFTILKPEEAAPVRAVGMRPLGNYAYHLDFSDGHHAGIYSLELLRELGKYEK
jgi:DUF971 family protein